MQIRNNQISTQPQSFKGIRINTSGMTDAQTKTSLRISDMLDYTDEYTKTKDTVDVYILPGKSEKSIIIKFMDKFSDMFYKKENKVAQASINIEKDDYNKSINEICDNLNKIDAGDYKSPELNVEKVLKGKTDFAKVDPDTYEYFIEDIDMNNYEELYGKAAKEEAVHSYNKTKIDTLNHLSRNFSEF